MTTIQEGLQKTQEQAGAEAKIAERYPDTHREVLPGRTEVWVSREVIDDASEILVMSSNTMAVLYVEVEGVPVFHPSYRDIAQVIKHFKVLEPEAYQRFVKAFATFVR
jgi:hypothetical protein